MKPLAITVCEFELSFCFFFKLWLICSFFFYELITRKVNVKILSRKVDLFLFSNIYESLVNLWNVDESNWLNQINDLLMQLGSNKPFFSDIRSTIIF